MTADISNVINVSLVAEGALASRDNPNIVAIVTDQQDGPLSSANRYQTYRNSADVATDFGTASQANQFATAFFGTQPNPINAGGELVVGYWRSASETVAASAAALEGAQLVESTVVSQLQGISDGSFDIDVDGTTVAVTGLDFRTITDMDGAVSLIDAAVTGATATYEDQRVVITSDTTGSSTVPPSTLSYATDPGTGTFVGNLLAIAEGTGATLTQGEDASTLAAETMEEGITALKAAVNIKGAMFIAAPTDADAKTLAEWAQANSVLLYDVFDTATNLNVDPANPVWDIKLSGLTNYRMLYSKAGNRKLAASYMARVHTGNFGAENSALTMQLKELSVAAESYSQTELNNAKAVGLDVYTTIKNTPCVLTSGANDFVDNRYNIIAFIDAVQTDFYNLLKQTGTKIPQTRRGVNQLIDQGEKTTRQFVRSGVFAPGTWSSPDSFGDRETFNRAIEANGFYWLAGSLADQAQADRTARKSPVLQAAVKNAGAFHSADIVIQFNA